MKGEMMSERKKAQVYTTEFKASAVKLAVESEWPFTKPCVVR
jgi:hypothetical protein